MTGGDIFHNMMLKHGVTHVFGYPGGAILPVFDAIYKSPHFEFILPRHEQGAGHMAQGYARVTGKPGVVLVAHETNPASESRQDVPRAVGRRVIHNHHINGTIGLLEHGSETRFDIPPAVMGDDGDTNGGGHHSKDPDRAPLHYTR